MNCLLLLLILCCCGQGNRVNECENNCMWRNVTSNDNCCNNNYVTVSRTQDCGCNVEVKEEDCGCNRTRNHEDNHNHGAFTTPPVARTQYPYLETEPRTCGCEETK